MNGRSGMKPSALRRFGSRSRSWLSTRMRPDVGFSSPAIIRIVVVLPAPFEESVNLARLHVERDAINGPETTVFFTRS